MTGGANTDSVTPAVARPPKRQTQDDIRMRLDTWANVLIAKQEKGRGRRRG
ncbi:MAG: hypothetical protein IMZ50_08805 [Candidatus Atribacteria bacterium]|nr:hypothetical protein [Candidatus Atribacteria bacterium]